MSKKCCPRVSPAFIRTLLSPSGSSPADLLLIFYAIYWDGNIEISNQPLAYTSWGATQQVVSNNLYKYNNFS